MKKVLLCLLLLLPMLCMGQREKMLHTRSKKAIRYYKQAKVFMYRRQYPEAARMLEDAVDKDKKFIEAHISAAFCYERLRKYDQAITHYEQALEYAPEERTSTKYYALLARLQLRKGSYEKALNNARQFLKSDYPAPALRQQAEQIVATAEYALEGMKNALQIEPQLLPDKVNHFPLQYFPVLTVDEQQMVYTARKGYGMNDDEDIYLLSKMPDGEWGEPESISDVINTPDNEGSTALSADGRMLIFTSCNGRKGLGRCDLYVSYKEGEEWSEPENLGEAVNSAAWESQPSLSADGKTLYFVSDRGGGYGGRDIWVSYLFENDEWSKAVNAGDVINSAKDEVAPFIHVNGRTLYFASERMPGYGGFDLYQTEKSSSGWSKPENLGYPINTHDDQISLFITADGANAYFSDEAYVEEGQVLSRIYTYEIPESARIKFKSNYVYGKVLDKTTRQPLKARVSLYDLEEHQQLSRVESDSLSGEYMMVLTKGKPYALYVDKQGYLFESLSFDYTQQEKLEPVYLNIYLQPIKSGAATRLSNIFFASGEYRLDPKSETELQKVVAFMEANPEVRIEVSGHTDNVGSAEFNQQLSVNRARAVYDFLLKAGVSKDRMRFKGYGQRQPVAPNDSEANRKRNRRIEFLIL